MTRFRTAVVCLVLACSGEERSAPRQVAPPAEPARPEPAEPEPPEPADEITHATSHEPHPHAADPHPPDEVTSATEAPRRPGAPFEGDELRMAERVRRNHERMRAMREAPVHVLPERDPLEAGRRICDAVVPRRPPDTPVLLKPNLSGFDSMRTGIDNGVELRTTGVDFLRGIVRCLRARGHREITITDAWSRPAERERWLRETGVDRLVAEEGVRFVGLWEDRGPDGRQSPMVAAPYPGARHLREELLVPRVLARHLERGLYISVPRMKMHRYAVTTLSIKNAMGVVVLRGAEEPNSGSGRMHAEIGPWLRQWRSARTDDREAYVRSLELFAERIVDVLEMELPDAVLIDGVPPVAGDGFRVIEPFDAGVAIGSINPVFADAVATEWLGYLDNEDLFREIRHRTSPLLEEAARRFYGTTDALRGVRVVGDDSFRSGERRVGRYVGFPGFEIGRSPRPAGALPWNARALVAVRAAEPPVLDGDLSDAAWAGAPPIRIDRDHAGRAAGPETIARLVWTDDALFAAFDCAYEPPLNVDEQAPIETEHERLYQHDVVELFLDESPRSRHTYREIELGPRGHFLDVAVDLRRRPRGDVAWSSGLQARTAVDAEARRFRVEVRIPAAAFGRERLRPDEWRVNLYRIAGRAPRTFLARFPTLTERPDFHVPDRFGWLRLVARP